MPSPLTKPIEKGLAGGEYPLQAAENSEEGGELTDFPLGIRILETSLGNSIENGSAMTSN